MMKDVKQEAKGGQKKKRPSAHYKKARKREGEPTMEWPIIREGRRMRILKQRSKVNPSVHNDDAMQWPYPCLRRKVNYGAE
jgi:hypothetical protein